MLPDNLSSFLNLSLSPFSFALVWLGLGLGLGLVTSHHAPCTVFRYASEVTDVHARCTLSLLPPPPPLDLAATGSKTILIHFPGLSAGTGRGMQSPRRF
jgi:hypothetical protein